jgi:benzylsuccinate synthase
MAVAEEVELKELEEKQEWWWLAEKKRSKRLDYLRKAVWKKGASGGMPISPVKYDLEPALLRMKLNEKYKRETPIMKKALIFSEMMDACSIYITDHAQLVGSLTDSPSTEPWIGSGGIGNKAVYNFPEILPEPLEESLKIVNDVGVYWDHEGDGMDEYYKIVDPEDIAKFTAGAFAWGTPHGGYSGKNYEYYMTGKRAFEAIIDEIDQKIAETEEKTIGPSHPDLIPLYQKINN